MSISFHTNSSLPNVSSLAPTQRGAVDQTAARPPQPPPQRAQTLDERRTEGWRQRVRFMQQLLLSDAGKTEAHADAQVIQELREHRFAATTRLLMQENSPFLDTVINAFAEFKEEMRKQQPGEKDFKKCEKRLIEMLAGHLPAEGKGQKAIDKNAKAKAKTKTLYKQAVVDHLNAQQWEPINETFAYKGSSYTSHLTPASRIKLGDHNVFKEDYQGKGVASGSTTCTNHATNLWISEFTAKNASSAKATPLFRGIRHGILSPYGVKGKTERRAGAENRAREVVTAALFLDQKKLQAALAGNTVDLKLTSTSLVTAFNFRNQTEGKQISDQIKAWDKLSSEQPCTLQIRDADGSLKTVKINLQVAAFNVGVNEAALNMKVGWGPSDQQNEKALRTLLGDDLSTKSGWVGEYLASQPEPGNAKVVRGLSAQIRQIWNDQSHHSDGGEPYKLAQRIALLSHEIGVVPCYNCKSGKDRTGMLDSELKREAVQLHSGGSLSTPAAKLTSEQQGMFRKVLANSGNLGIQKVNTGAPGNKVLKKLSAIGNNLSLRARIGSEEVFDKIRGASGAVKS